MPVVTVHQVRRTLRNAIAYIVNPMKTVQGQAVSVSQDLGVWFPSNRDDLIGYVTSEMMRDLDSGPHRGRRTRFGGMVLAEHVIQSFDPADSSLTWQQVHEMGMELAQKITHGKYKYVVATHTNRKHLHNHIIICQASSQPGHKRIRVRKTTLKTWRSLSDSIALEHDVPVLPEPVQASGRNIKEIYATLRGVGRLERLRSIVAEAAARCDSFDSFTRFLADHGVSVRARGRQLVYTDTSTGLKARGTRLGSWCTMEGVATRLEEDGVLSCITINKKLIASATHDAITVWLPDSRRTRQAVLPRRAATFDGKTWTVWLSQDDTVPIRDKDGGYKGIENRDQILTHFGVARVSWFEPLPDNRMRESREANRLTAKSEGQLRYLDWVDGENIRIQDMIDATNAIRKWAGWPGGQLTPETIANAIGKAMEEIDRLHKMHSHILADDEEGSDSGDRDRRLEHFERRAALVDRDITLMRGELEHVLQPVKQEQEQREAPEQQTVETDDLTVTNGQERIINLLAGRDLITPEQANQIDRETAAQAQQWIEQAVQQIQIQEEKRQKRQRRHVPHL